MRLDNPKHSSNDGSTDIRNRTRHCIKSVCEATLIRREYLPNHAVCRWDNGGRSDAVKGSKNEKSVLIRQDGIDNVENRDSKETIAKDRFGGI